MKQRKKRLKYYKNLLAASKAIDRELAVEKGTLGTYRGLHVIHGNRNSKRKTRRSVKHTTIVEQQE